ATLPELAVLGMSMAEQLPRLRDGLIGTPTIHTAIPRVDTKWGGCCTELLAQMHDHPSKAAKSYYFKTFAQYFAAIFQSLEEMARCIKRKARCVVVVQD